MDVLIDDQRNTNHQPDQHSQAPPSLVSISPADVGDSNYDFHTKKGNSGFDAFLVDGVWKWIKPAEMIDTNWSDDNGKDRYPDSMLDFNFVAGAVKDWKAECRTIVRDGDFPDDDKSSDHRPVELILKN